MRAGREREVLESRKTSESNSEDILSSRSHILRMAHENLFCVGCFITSIFFLLPTIQVFFVQRTYAWCYTRINGKPSIYTTGWACISLSDPYGFIMCQALCSKLYM